MIQWFTGNKYKCRSGFCQNVEEESSCRLWEINDGIIKFNGEHYKFHSKHQYLRILLVYLYDIALPQRMPNESHMHIIQRRVDGM